MPGPLSVATRRPRIDPRGAEAPPDIGLFDGRAWSSGWRQNENAVDTGRNRVGAANEIGYELRDKLAKRGIDVPYNPMSTERLWTRKSLPSWATRDLRGRDFDNAAFWRAVKGAQQMFPEDFADAPGDEDGLLQHASDRTNKRLEEAQATDARLTSGGKLASFLGNVGASYNDTETLLGLLAAPLGGGAAVGRSVLAGVGRAALIEGGVNAGIAVAVEPAVRSEAAARGVKRDWSDTAYDVAVQGTVGAAFGAVGEAAVPLAKAGWRRLSGASPEPRPRSNADVVADGDEDRELVAQLRAIPEGERTAEERAALTVLERSADMAAANPVPASVGSAERHAQRAEAGAIELVTGDRPRGPSGMEAPAAGTDLAAYMRVNRSAESSGNDIAQATTSSAFGRYQFTKKTWKGYYVRRFGRQGLSDDQILSKRADGALQDRLMMDLTNDNARALRKAGQVPTNDALYLMHFAGVGDGLKVMDAAADAPVAGLMRADSIAANPFLARMNAGELRAWAARKMKVRPGEGGSGLASTGDDAADALAATIADLDVRAAGIDQELQGLDVVRARAALDDAGDDPMALGGGAELDDAVDVPGMPRMRVGTRLSSEVDVDAGLMQFKAGGDAFGVTERLQGVEDWNPAFAGRVILWEAKDGRLVVADGHQRVGLAKRIGAAKGEDVPLDVMILREADGVPAGEARAFAALKNISEGSGSAIDAAKVFREIGRDRALAMLPPRSPLARDADALSRLSDDAFGAVVNELVRPEHAAIVGRLLPDDPEMHAGIVDFLIEEKPRTVSEADAYVRQHIAAGFVDWKQSDMFGELDRMRSLFKQRAKVRDRLLSKLREQRSTFGMAAKRAQLLEEGGNAIDATASAAAAARAAQAIDLIERLSFSEGPIGDALNRGARALESGQKPGDVTDGLFEELGAIDLDAVSRQADAPAPEIAAVDADAAAATGADAPIDADTLSLFDAPDGPGVAAQTDSLVHDARAVLQRTGPQEVVGPVPANGVAPAFLANDGRVYSGEIGTQHFTAVSDELRAVGIQGSGFVDPSGRFLNRVDALAYVNANGENIKPSPSMVGELDALDYKEQSKFARPIYKREAPAPTDVSRVGADGQAGSPARGVTDGVVDTPENVEAARLDAGARLALRGGEPAIVLDEGAEPIALRALIEEFDADDAAVVAARNCL